MSASKLERHCKHAERETAYAQGHVSAGHVGWFWFRSCLAESMIG